jgi:CRP-like cAMP-binding protein
MADDPRTAEALAVLGSKTCPFSALIPELRESLLSTMEICDYPAGQALIRREEPGSFLLVIMSGTAEAFIENVNSHRTKVGEFGRGEVVGEISPLTGEVRTADVVSRTPVRALRLSAADFHQAAIANPEVRMLLTNVLADRLGKATYDGLGGKDIHGYRVLRCIGRGGMGVVYAARQLSTGRTVALKMLNHRLLYQPGAVKRFRQEAETLKSLDHEGIARLFECFAAYGTQFLVMEYCEGSTLKELLAGGKALEERVVRPMVGQLAGALRDIHTRGLVHRDLKPSNIVISPSGVVKLLDFGLAKSDATWPAGSGSNARTVSDSATLHGTPRYMAPEQFKHAVIDYRVDLYGLANVTFEALAGRPIVEASDLFGIVEEKLGFILPPPREIGRGISEEMHTFLARGLEIDPDKRVVDLEALARWAAPVPVAKPQPK